MTGYAKRSVAFVSAAVILTIATVCAAIVSRPGIGSNREFAVFSVPENTDDRNVVTALMEAGAREVVSESNQWVYIDDFGSLERVPLDQFRERIESFDPRDDGYEEQLRSLFISGGERHFFVFMKQSFFAPLARTQFRKAISSSFGGDEYRLDMPEHPSFKLDLLLIAASLLVALIFFKVPIAALGAAPSFAAFALFGPPGFASAGLLLVGLKCGYGSSRELARSWFGAGSNRQMRRPWIRDGIVPSACLVFASLIVALVGGVPPIVAVFAVISSVMDVFSMLIIVEIHDRARGHSRFMPLRLSPQAFPIAELSRVAVPFTIAAFVSLAISGVASVHSPSFLDVNSRGILERYREHMAFQRSFSTTRLEISHEESDLGGYHRYHLDATGLVVNDSRRPEYVKETQIPVELPPAERMLSRLNAPSSLFLGASNVKSGSLGGLVFALIVSLLAATPAFASRVRSTRFRRAQNAYTDKRIAA